MIIILYSFGLKIIEMLLRLASLFNPKAKALIQGKKQVWESLKQLKNNTSPLLWVHCSSVGEYEQGRPVMEAFKQQFPDYKILVTFYSPSGYQAVEADQLLDFKTYLPFDSRKNAKKLIGIINPKVVFFIKYEFWYYYLNELKIRQIPTYSISSIFRPNQLFFKWYGDFYRNMLHSFSYFFVQNKASYKLLQDLNLPCTITGDTRLDRVLNIKEQKRPMPEIEAFASSGRELMLIGSMRKEDINIVLNFVKHHSELKFIIAPHEITEAMMRPLEESLTSTIRHSNINGSTTEQQVLIVDNIGMLSHLYRFANYAYIGGGFSDGIHNILEPAVYEIPVFFGNKDYQRFKEAIDLIDIGAAFPIGSSPEFEVVFKDLADNSDRLVEIKRVLASYLADNRGASEKIIGHLQTNLS